VPNFHFRLIKLNIVEDLTEMIMTQNSQISRLQQPLSFYPSRLRQGQGDAVFINIQLSQTCYFGWDSVEKYGEFLYSYNANNAVSSITHSNVTGSQIVKHSYTYDETNNIVEYLNSIDGQTSYDYDFLGQLIGADYSNQNLDDETYTYDENGNRITANGSNYTTGDNNELTSDGTWSYTYDSEGNRISKTNAANTERELYTWDYRNRLTTVTKQTYDTLTNEWTTVQIVEYAYDYNNIWIRKTLDTNGDGIADSKTIFIPENYQTTVQIDNGTVSHHYLWTPNQQDKLLADTTSTDVLWSLTDHLGTIRDVLGATTTHLIYDAFGNLTSGTNPLLFGYTGKAFDSATNLQNNINRWCDAAVGRWLSTDPIGFEGDDTNLYRYSLNNGLAYLDASGYECKYFDDNSLNVRWSYPFLVGVIPKVTAAIGTNPGIHSFQPAREVVGIQFREITIWEHCDRYALYWSGACPIIAKRFEINLKKVMEYRIIEEPISQNDMIFVGNISISSGNVGLYAPSNVIQNYFRNNPITNIIGISISYVPHKDILRAQDLLKRRAKIAPTKYNPDNSIEI